MIEIAEMFKEGFEALGVPAAVRLDEVPDRRDPGTLVVIVAPHEFFPLFLRNEVPRHKAARMAGDWFLLNTEQPGSQWFELACRYALGARGVFDINRRGAAAFHVRGVGALYTPLGYTESLERLDGPCGPDKRFDLLFLGYLSPRRERFFARHAGFFQNYDCRFIFADVGAPRQATDPNVWAGPRRNRLVRQGKILLNVHAAGGSYFEWHRALCAAANGCLVVSEASEGAEPFRGGDHLVFGDLEELPGLCEHYLRDEAERRAIVERAYALLREQVGIGPSCRTMLEAASAAAGPHVSLPARARLAARAVRDYAANGLRGARQALWDGAYATVTSNSLAWRLRCYLRWTGGADGASLEAYDERRHAILRRLASASNAGAAAAPVAWDNPAYPTSPPPAVSVVVTLYNYEAHIAECLESVAACDVTGLPGGVEVVVVDDASTDSSARRVTDFASRSRLPVRLVRKPHNTGLADARNVGAAQARAPYLFILDADNVIFPHGLAKLHGALKASGQAGAYGIIAKFDSTTREGVGLVSHLPWDARALLRDPYIDAMAMLDREKLLAVGGYSTDLIRYGWFGWEDYDLWLKFVRAGHACCHVPEIVAGYRVHSRSMLSVTTCYTPNIAAHLAAKYRGLVGDAGARNRFVGMDAAGIPAVARRMGDDGVIVPEPRR